MPSVDIFSGMDNGSVEEEVDALVMAMPRRELFAVSGFITEVQLQVLQSLQFEHWFALPEHIDEDIEAKEVRIGLLISRNDQYLVDSHGILLHVAQIPPEVEQFGEGLLGLKNLAQSAGKELLQQKNTCIELWGYLNEDSMVETRAYFILIYQMRVEESCPTPDDMAWVSMKSLNEMPLDPASALFASVLSSKQ